MTFRVNIGLVIVRTTQTCSGDFCKTCIHKEFWQATGTTLLLGWWGVISMIVTPYFLLSNIVQYATCLKMEPVSPLLKLPISDLNEDTINRLEPHAEDMMGRLNSGADLIAVIRSITERTGVSTVQVALFIRAADMVDPNVPKMKFVEE